MVQIRHDPHAMISLLKRTASTLLYGRLDRRTGAHDVPGPWIESVRDDLTRGNGDTARLLLVKALARFPRSRELMDLAVAVERRTGIAMLPKVNTEARFQRDLVPQDALGLLAALDEKQLKEFSDFLSSVSGERPGTPGFPAALALLERRDVPVGCPSFPQWIESSFRVLATDSAITAVVVAGSVGAEGWSMGKKLDADDHRMLAATKLASIVIAGTKGIGIGAHLESTLRGRDGEVICVGTYGHVITVATARGVDSRRYLPKARDLAGALGRHFLQGSHAMGAAHD